MSKQVKALLVEKVNHRYQRMTEGSRQASGLSVCLKMIADAVDGLELAQVDTLTDVSNIISRLKPNKVIFQTAWISVEDIEILRSRFNSVDYYVHIHSNIPFLALEGAVIRRFNEYSNAGVKVIFNDHRSLPLLKDSIYLPNIYTAPIVMPIKGKHDSESDTINIICAGSLRPMKNHITQALGAILFARSEEKKLRFHVNMGRSEGGNEIAAGLTALFSQYPEHELVSIPWLSHVDFIKYCATMDYGLQVSMSESFNITAADYAAAGIPSVVSDEIYWAYGFSIAEIGSPKSICATLNSASDSSVMYNRNSLDVHRTKAIAQWKDFIK